jgi:hemerythrin-like metal-binding protein
MGQEQILRDRVTYYRRRLAEGVGTDEAARCLREIAKAETELRQLEADRAAAAAAANAGGLRLQWNDAFAVGHEALDAEHRDLIDRINRLCTAFEARADKLPHHADLRALIEAVKSHFEHEGEVLGGVAGGACTPRHAKAISRSAIDAHVVAHGNALDELHALVGRIEQALAAELPHFADELVRWFVVHAVQHDSQLKAVFQAI